MKAGYLYQSPIGPLYLVEEEGSITHLALNGDKRPDAPEQSTPLLRESARQLDAYFGKSLREFSLPLAPRGTPFQQSVWCALCKIPYGETRSYGEIARLLKKPGAARAVGMANHCNPIPIFIPCHRVVGTNGRLVGYRGGLPVKEILLKLERV